MKDDKPRVLLSDGKFYYRCTLRELFDKGFTACGLPTEYDDKAVSDISLVLSSNVTLKMGLEVCSTKISSDCEKKDVVFRIKDPPLLWKSYIEDI